MYFTLSPFAAAPRAAARTEIPVPSGGIFVPASFFGLNTQDWPVRAGTSGGNGPTFPVGSLAAWDCPPLHWRSLHSAANVINWANLDTFVSAARASGIAEGMYALYGCPTFLASSGAAVAGPYGGLGEGAYPNDLSQLSYFCQQFAARNIGVWGRFFRQIQLFNEPDFTQTVSGGTFWWGTRAQFVDTLYTAYAAVQAADPTLVVMSPGTFSVTNGNTGMDQWISQAGAVNPGIVGANCFDALAMHPYHARPNGSYGLAGDIASLQLGGLLKFRALLQPLGKWPIDCYVTEYGVSSAADAELAEFNSGSAEYRRLLAFRNDMAFAAAGVKKNHIFSLGNAANLCSNLDSVTLNSVAPDTSGFKLGRAQAYAAMAGKRIVAAGWYADGRQEINWSDGSVLTV